MQRLKDRYRMTHLRKLGCRGKPGRTCSDHCNASAGWFWNIRDHDSFFHLVISHKSLKPTDCDRIAIFFLSKYANRLALRLLRADSSADRWKRVCALQRASRRIKIAICNLTYEEWDIHLYRAALNAQRLFTVETALCLCHRFFFRVSECNLAKVRSALGRRLLCHFKPYFRF